ncbi:MAG: hypothetical protein ACE5IR_28235 [bacterium]
MCRRGGPANKPFCDGTHRKNNFEAAQVELPVEAQLSGDMKAIQTFPPP